MLTTIDSVTQKSERWGGLRSVARYLAIIIGASLSEHHGSEENSCVRVCHGPAHYLFAFLTLTFIGSNFFWKVSGTMTTCTNGRKPLP